MATRVIFQDPIAQYLNRYKITHLGEDLYEIQISPGTVTQEGTPLIAANLNSITNEVIFHVEDTNEQANVFEANIQGLGEYYTSLSIIMKSNTTNTSASTINLSGLGVKAIKKVDKNGNKINVQENDIIRNKYEMFVYDGTDFILVNPNADIAQLISDLNSIEKKVNSLSQDVQNMKNFTPRFATTTGINNDYDINIDGIAQYVTGMRITIVADRTNTGSSTLNINSLSKKNILFNGSSIPANTLQTNKLYDVIYNGVSFELQPSASQASKLNDIGNINDSTLPIELKGKVLTEQTKQIKKEVDEHKAEIATQAHLAKNIGVEDANNSFVATDVEGALNELFQSGVNLKNTMETEIIAKEGMVSKVGEIATQDELVNGIRSIPVGGIKSIQRGEAALRGIKYSTTHNISISPIDMSKSIVYYSTGLEGSTDVKLDNSLYHAEIVDNSTIRFTRQASNNYSDDFSKVYWIVIEFEGVKNKQHGITHATPDTDGYFYIDISPVDENKSILITTASSDVSGQGFVGMLSARKLCPNKIQIYGRPELYYAWQVLEFY